MWLFRKNVITAAESEEFGVQVSVKIANEQKRSSLPRRGKIP
jgi:hypothetical protein